MSGNESPTTHDWEFAKAQLQEQFDQLTLLNQQKYQTFMDEIKGMIRGLTTPTQVPERPGLLGPPPLRQGYQVQPIEHGGQPPRFPTMKLELQKFDGSDANGWIFRVQEYFDFHDTPADQRLRIVAFNFEGQASEWYQGLKSNRKLTTWTDFLIRVKLRFGPSKFEDYEAQLAKLPQSGTVVDYIAEFERLLNKVDEVSEYWLLSMFIGGLRSDIKRDLQMGRPQSLPEAFSLAKMFEARNEEQRSEIRSGIRWQNRQSNPSSNSRGNDVLTQNTTPSASQPQSGGMSKERGLQSNLPIRRLNPEEMQAKCAKRECYNCDQQWSVNHRCNNKFLLLIGDGDYDDCGDDDDGAEEPAIMGDISSLNAWTGTTAILAFVG